MTSDFDIENADADQGESGIIMTAVVLLLSIAVHVGLMYACSDCAFAPMTGEPPSDQGRKWTKQVPIMQVQKQVDNVRMREIIEARPAAAPDAEKQEERVERLASSTESSVVPEMPRSAATAPIADLAPEPAKIDAAEWKPRQEIAAVEAPVVPDDQAALPRIVIPKVERVGNAADIVPAFDLMKATGKSAGGGGSDKVLSLSSLADAAAASESAATAAPAAAPMPTSLGGASGGAGGLGGATPSLNVLSAAEEAAAKKAADDERAAAKAEKAADRLRAEEAARAEKRPVPPAPQTTMVDEKVVAAEKEAVRTLRDETIFQGKPFEKHVKLNLGSWVDPDHPKFKYFRLLMSSRAEEPLPVIAKDIVFLMDASGSIANDRLKKCRKAVVKALRMLNTGDRFNVVAFRDKFSFAFPDAAWVDVTEKNLESAEDWLGALTAHGQTDVFRTLRGVLAMPRDPARPVIAFVITDGDATSGMTRSAEIISKFSELNGGLISVYMYGVKDTANAYLMDMLTRGSRGGWSRNEKLRWNAADGIPELAKKFERPVLSDITVLFSASSQAETYPQLVSNLCEDEPIAIYGVCPASQQELVFSMRGLNGSSVFESVFRIPFDKAERLDGKVKVEWAQRRMYALIAAYTASPSKELLRDIQLFADSHKIQIPYEREIRK